jgi:hypothetical protein
MATDASELADLIALWHGIELPLPRAIVLARVLDELLRATASGRRSGALTVDLVDFDRFLSDFSESSRLSSDRCSN